MKFLKFLTLTFLLFYGTGLLAQDCNVELTQIQIDYVNNTRALRNNMDIDCVEGVIHYIPVQFHIIRNAIGGGSHVADIADMEDELDIVNDLYAPNSMVFFQCETVNYIDDGDAYSGIWSNSIANANNVDGKINIYCLPNDDISFASYPDSNPSNDRIVYVEDQWNNGSTLAHEIGHFFNLRHTHQEYNSFLGIDALEHPHRWGANMNCGDNIGDELCDTPADPVLHDRVDNNCEYDPDLDTTPDDYSSYRIDGLTIDDYNPNPNNIMCWINADLTTCRDFLSDGQLERVLRSYMCDRNYLFCGDQTMPDLVVIDETKNKDAVKAGKKIYVTSNVKNIGGATTGTHSYMKYYLSDDPLFQANEDTYLKYDKVDTLAANETGFESQLLKIPASTPSGVKYILFVADGTYKVDESNEINNVTAMQIMVTSCEDGADLIVLNQTVSTTTIEAGELIYLEATVKNIGNERAVNNTRLKYYLSDDDVFGGDTYIYYDYIDNLDPEEENFETANIRIPENTPTGNYYMLWKADATDMDDESNENNNVAVQPIFVTASTGKTHHQESTEMLSTQLKVNAAPNPFAETTTIEYTLDKPSTVFVDIYDVTGKKVAQLVEGEDQTEGKQTMSFEATDLPDGLYFCQVKIGDRQETIRILLQR